MADIEKRIRDLLSNEDMATNIISLFATALIIWFVFYFLFKATLQSRKCSSLTVTEKKNTVSINGQNDLIDTQLNKFYIKTFY